MYPGEPCDLGAINLAAYVEQGQFDMQSFKQDVHSCIRFLDNVLDVNNFALEDNRTMSHRLRRLGLGVMGLADALIKLGKRYDSDEGRQTVADIIATLRHEAIQASEALAAERGAFPECNRSSLESARRNVALLTVAPTGTTSMLMGVSSGVEPIFAPFMYRKIGSDYVSIISELFKELLEQHPPHPEYRQGQSWDWEKVVEAVQANHGSVQGLDFIPEDVRAVLVCAHDIAPRDHVLMQATVQRAFDAEGMAANSISKTINLPNHASVDDVYQAYSLAFETGCKGITVYRDGSRQFQVLSTSKKAKSQAKQLAPSTTPASPSPVSESSPLLPGEPLFDRPARVTGFTDAIKLTTTHGEKRGFYVTVNKQDGLPSEVFILSGKAGDESNADSEAMGRLVSIALQYGVPAQAIINTLRGINGGMYGSYQGRMVTSKADLVAVALETSGISLEDVSLCPDGPDCLIVKKDGCETCQTCGYSKCG